MTRLPLSSVLPDGRGPRRSTPPSRAKATLYRMRQTAREVAIELAVAAIVGGFGAIGWLAYLATH